MQDNITKFLLEQKFKIKDLSVTPRQMNYWKNKNIFPFLKSNRMAVLNLSQALYLELITDLSKVGIETKSLEKLSTSIWINSKFSTFKGEKFEDIVDFCIKFNDDIMFIYSPNENKHTFVKKEQIQKIDFNTLFNKKQTLIIIPNLISFLAEKINSKISK